MVDFAAMLVRAAPIKLRPQTPPLKNGIAPLSLNSTALIYAE